MATAAKIDNQRIALPKRAHSSRAEQAARHRRHLGVGLLITILLGIVLVHVWLRLQVVQMGYVLSTASKLQNRLEQENRELKVELATLTTRDRIDEMARRRLGLMAPQKGQVIVLP
jgi:cell division protein FtsL